MKFEKKRALDELPQAANGKNDYDYGAKNLYLLMLLK